MEKNPTPLFTIVIPTYNRRDSLRHTIENLAYQTFLNFEVVVVIDGGQDDSAALLAGLASRLPFPLRYIEQANAGPAQARNRGAEAAHGQYLLFIDDDIEATPELVAEHWRMHQQQANLVVIGVTPAPPGDNGSAWFKYEAKALEKKYNKVRTGRWEAQPRMFYTGNASVSKADFWRVGGFDTKLRRGEDIELGYRLGDAGLKFGLNEQAVGLHLSEARSLKAWLRIPYTYGLIDARLDLGRNRYGILAEVGQLYRECNPLTRALLRLCLDKPWLYNTAMRAGSMLARLNSGRIGQLASSALFNLRYYQGIVDGLGAVEVWWKFAELTMLNRYRQRPQRREQADLPGISLVVRPSASESNLKECLENLLASRYPNFEVLVVGPVDARPFQHDRRVIYASAGEVLPLAKYDLIGFMDGTFRPGPDWLEEVARVFANRPEVDLISCPALNKTPEPPSEWKHSRYWGAKQLENFKAAPQKMLPVMRRAVLSLSSEGINAISEADFYQQVLKAGFIHLHHSNLPVGMAEQLPHKLDFEIIPAKAE